MKNKNEFNVTLLRCPIVFSAKTLNMSSVTPPLALAYLSSELRESGFSVTNIDSVGEKMDQVDDVMPGSGMQYQGLSIEEILERIDPKTDLLGVSCMFSSEWVHAKRIIKAIKNKYPELSIIVGGEHATALPEVVLEQCPEIDAIALGEGEETIIDLAESYRCQKGLEKIRGIAYRRKSEIIRTEPRQRIRKIDDIPWPAWDLLPIDAYLNSGLSHGPYRGKTIPMLASRGCPYECTFCSNPVMYGKTYVTRDPEDLLDEIAVYQKKYGVQVIDFYDLTTITSRKWILRFCDLIIQREMSFSWQISGGTRTEAIDEEVIIKAKKAGCEYLGFAPESGSREVIKVIKKRVDLKRMLKLFKIGVKHKVGTRANLIIGFPKETRFQIYETLYMQIKLALIGVLDAPIFEFTPYPGSEDFDYLRSKNYIGKLDDNYFDSLATDLSFGKNRRYCEKVGPKELKFYQITGMALFYGTHYLVRPKKLVGFIRNIFGNKFSDNVFEQRILGNIKRFHLFKINT